MCRGVRFGLQLAQIGTKWNKSGFLFILAHPCKCVCFVGVQLVDHLLKYCLIFSMFHFRFIEVGGWDILNTWLDLSRTDNNEPLLGEILEVYQNLPVTVSLLKKNGAAKTIKHLTKTDNESKYSEA